MIKNAYFLLDVGYYFVCLAYWHGPAGVNQELGAGATSGIKTNRLLLSEALSLSWARM